MTMDHATLLGLLKEGCWRAVEIMTIGDGLTVQVEKDLVFGSVFGMIGIDRTVSSREGENFREDQRNIHQWVKAKRRMRASVASQERVHCLRANLYCFFYVYPALGWAGGVGHLFQGGLLSNAPMVMLYHRIARLP